MQPPESTTNPLRLKSLLRKGDRSSQTKHVSGAIAPKTYKNLSNF
ncbi:hypothetical protein [Dapis sp. BLCC M172]